MLLAVDVQVDPDHYDQARPQVPEGRRDELR